MSVSRRVTDPACDLGQPAQRTADPSACAAARPGAPAGHRTRPAGLRRRSRATVSRRGLRRPDRTPKTTLLQEARADRAFYHGWWRSIQVSVRGPLSPAAAQATLAPQVLVLLDVLLPLGPGRRFGAKAPRHQREASSACPRGQGPPPRPAAQCPAPTAAWVTTGTTGDTHSGIPEGLTPSRTPRRSSRRSNRSPLSSPAIPALSSRRHAWAKLPGCRHPDADAQRGQGAGAQVRPHPRERPAAHLLKRDLLAGLRGPSHLLLPRTELPRTGDPGSNPGDSIHYEFNLVNAEWVVATAIMAIKCWKTGRVHMDRSLSQAEWRR